MGTKVGPKGERWRVPFCPDCGEAGTHAQDCSFFAGQPVVHGNFEWVVLEQGDEHDPHPDR